MLGSQTMSAPVLGTAFDARTLATLALLTPVQPGQEPHLAAGSGLVTIADTTWVVSDDENHIGQYTTSNPAAVGIAVRVFAGDLPIGKGRGKVKPDLEALVAIPRSLSNASQGAWLVGIPSGSTDSRQTGFALALDAVGKRLPAKNPGTVPSKSSTRGSLPDRVDFSPVMKALARVIPGRINIEGAVVDGSDLVLFNRGNSVGGSDATVRIPLTAVHSLIAGRPLPGDLQARVTRYDLGLLGGVKLTFSDAAALGDGRIAFSASAEGSADATSDGHVVGSAVGIMERDGSISMLRPFSEKGVKVEGLAVSGAKDGALLLRAVTDADDPTIAGRLLEFQLPAAPR